MLDEVVQNHGSSGESESVLGEFLPEVQDIFMVMIHPDWLAAEGDICAFGKMLVDLSHEERVCMGRNIALFRAMLENFEVLFKVH